MPELRWTLLALGVLFLAALAWWEFRKSRRTGRDSPRPAPPPPREPAFEAPRHREPTFTLPEISDRESARDLPVMEVADDSMIGLRIDGERIEDEPESVREEPLPMSAEPDEEVVEVTEREAPKAMPLPEFSEPLPEPVVDWPEDESQRRILAVRIASRREERFSGRAVRQALASEGFVFGKFSIFHRAARDGRVVLSVTSLTKPGSFEISLMDTQRFVGISVFAVLPGPLAPGDALELLLDTGRNLNERLDGVLEDERGGPLTPEKIAALRESVAPAPDRMDDGEWRPDEGPPA